MKSLIHKMLTRALSRWGLETIASDDLEKLKQQKRLLSQKCRTALICLELLGSTPEEFNTFLGSSRSQLGQDLFAYLTAGQRRGGFFVEFGAGDGVALSNTVLLEREFEWTGILAEPLEHYHASITAHRSAVLDTRCVWRSSGATLDFVGAGYLSTIEQFRNADSHALARASAGTISVETVSLWDLLEQHGAPSSVDFLSIDTEGSEYEILSAFPFGEKYSIKAISCEHNYSSSRDAVSELLLNNGYVRIASSLSAHDDWFVLSHGRDEKVEALSWSAEFA